MKVTCDRGGLAQPAQLDQALRERGLRHGRSAPGRDQQAAAGRRRERHRDLELRIIAAAGALIGLRPAAHRTRIRRANGI